MMREVKFRAFINNEMIPSDSLAFEEYAPLQDQLASVEHLMQFTGLHDKNGEEIYEGDILRHRYEDHIGSVRFSAGAFITDCEGFGERPISTIDTGWVEVIGNIYENPELATES